VHTTTTTIARENRFWARKSEAAASRRSVGMVVIDQLWL
jgi:hypothetical protein